MTKKLHHKVILVLVIAVLLYQSVQIVYALWGNNSTIISSNEVYLSDGASINVEKMVNQHHVLVPKDSFMANYYNDEIYIYYTVYFNKTGNLRITIDPKSIKIGDGNHDYNDLIVISISDKATFNANISESYAIIPFDTYDETEELYSVEVMFKVHLSTPNDNLNYDLVYERIKNQSISFEITFEAVNQTIN
jgi:hypothetical protein